VVEDCGGEGGVDCFNFFRPFKYENMRILTLFIIIFFDSGFIYGQNNLDSLDLQWSKLKFEYKGRSEFINELPQKLKVNAKSEQELLLRVEENSTLFNDYIRNKVSIDSSFITNLFYKKISLEMDLELLFFSVKENDKIKSDSNLNLLIARYEGIKKKIQMIEYDYNNICVSQNLFELMLNVGPKTRK
jgi:hypothetical protein